jgi:hypothetical protein
MYNTILNICERVCVIREKNNIFDVLIGITKRREKYEREICLIFKKTIISSHFILM